MNKVSLNSKQMIGIYVATAAIVIVVFLHSPWTGYTTAYGSFTGWHAKLPFWDWHTKYPLLHWLGTLKNLAATVVFIILLTAIWAAAVRSPPERGDGGA